MDSSYTAEEVAYHIAREKKKDKFKTHVAVAQGRRQDFARYGRGGVENVKTREEYAQVVVAVMKHPDTECFRGQSWDAYYHRDTNIFVTVCRADIERSTAFPPRAGERYWKKVQKEEKDIRKELGLPPLVIHRGGISKLNSSQHLKNTEKSKGKDQTKEALRQKLLRELEERRERKRQLKRNRRCGLRP